ncbi:hypothetical protein G5I_11035 [Acromyrmex echinatior]|uniref:Uncharacterized protein n=1 Tax=Acromyrmex echinatior TaxID=103372 RepID=F4WYI2_ACREC|nr:hypothetical protein G5I_11035 [Acromyrmex echinatior]
MNAKSVPEDCDPRRRDKDVRIPPVAVPTRSRNRCLHYLTRAKNYSLAVDCQKMNDCAIRLSSVVNKWLEFSSHCNKERVLFIVYADL